MFPDVTFISKRTCVLLTHVLTVLRKKFLPERASLRVTNQS